MKKIVVSILVLVMLSSLASFAFATAVSDIGGAWTFDDETKHVVLTIDMNNYLYWSCFDKTSGNTIRYIYEVFSDPYVENHFCAVFTYTDGSAGCYFVNLQEDGTLVMSNHPEYVYTKLR